jgi:hypothetical protein
VPIVVRRDDAPRRTVNDIETDADESVERDEVRARQREVAPGRGDGEGGLSDEVGLEAADVEGLARRCGELAPERDRQPCGRTSGRVEPVVEKSVDGVGEEVARTARG